MVSGGGSCRLVLLLMVLTSNWTFLRMSSFLDGEDGMDDGVAASSSLAKGTSCWNFDGVLPVKVLVPRN